MNGQIVKKFEETVYNALGKYSEMYNVFLEETGISLSLDENEDVQYIVLLATKNEDGKIVGYNKRTKVDFTSGILFKRVDFTGQSIYVPIFIKQIITSLCASHECKNNELFVNILPRNGKAVMYLYVKNQYKDILDLKELLE